MPVYLRDFLIVLAGTSSVLGAGYVFMLLTLGQLWVDSNASVIFAHALYWLLLPPVIWMVRFRPSDRSGFRSPRVKIILPDGVIITEPCEWMGYRTSVAVFKLQDDVEQLVFSAYVSNIQQNKMVQLMQISGGRDVDVSKLNEIRDKILIKPGQHYE